MWTRLVGLETVSKYELHCGELFFPVHCNPLLTPRKQVGNGVVREVAKADCQMLSQHHFAAQVVSHICLAHLFLTTSLMEETEAF